MSIKLDGLLAELDTTAARLRVEFKARATPVLEIDCRLAELDEARRQIAHQLEPEDRWPELATGRPWPPMPVLRPAATGELEVAANLLRRAADHVDDWATAWAEIEAALAVFRALGLLTKPVGRSRKPETAEQRRRRLFDAGMSIKEIAGKENVTEKTAKRALRARKKKLH